MVQDQHVTFMAKALEQAQKAQDRGEVPIGAVLVHKGEIIAAAGNETFALPDPTAHAEIQALRAGATFLNEARLVECDLYVTLEPCPMCAQALSFARIRRLYFGAYDPKGGGVEHGARLFSQSTCHHAPDVYGGVMEVECGKILQDFFQSKRD